MQAMNRPVWKLNTSNKDKFKEFQRLFADYGSSLEVTHIDLKEIDADPIQVIAHKASQLGENILVEDTSLDIEGAFIGIHIKWLLDHLSEYVGHKALWTVLLAYRQQDHIHIYKGSIPGTITFPKGKGGFGFDPFFLPDGASATLAESKPDSFNARAKAVSALLERRLWTTHPLIENWNGKWQG